MMGNKPELPTIDAIALDYVENEIGRIAYWIGHEDINKVADIVKTLALDLDQFDFNNKYYRFGTKSYSLKKRKYSGR